jgi:hypothetical protein
MPPNINFNSGNSAVDSKRCKSNPCPTLYGSTGGSAAAALILFLILFVLVVMVMFVLLRRRNSFFDRVVQLLPEK